MSNSTYKWSTSHNLIYLSDIFLVLYVYSFVFFCDNILIPFHLLLFSILSGAKLWQRTGSTKIRRRPTLYCRIVGLFAEEVGTRLNTSWLVGSLHPSSDWSGSNITSLWSAWIQVISCWSLTWTALYWNLVISSKVVSVKYWGLIFLQKGSLVK